MNAATKFVLAGFIMLASIFGVASLSIAQAQPAYAAGCIGSGMNACFNASIKWSGSNSVDSGGIPGKPSTGSGAPVQGGSIKAPVIPCKSYSRGSTTTNQPSYPWTSIGGGGNSCLPAYYTNSYISGPGSCPAVTVKGFKLKARGMIQTQRYEISFLTYQKKMDVSPGASGTSGSEGYYRYTLRFPIQRTCVYPKVNEISQVRLCALKVAVTLDRTNVSRSGAKRFGVQPGTKTFASISGLQNQTSPCVTSANVNFTTNVENNERNWGQYKMDGTLTYTRCYEGTITFDGKKLPSVYRCSGTYVGGAVANKFTLWCAGKSNGWVSKKWDASDCGNGTANYRHKCAVPKATFDGKTGTVQTLRDGKKRIVNWGNPKLTGNVRNATNWRSYTRIVGGSTPLNRAASLNSSTQQYFSSDQTFNTWLKNDRTQSMGFYNASNPGGSFRMTRDLKFDAQFKVNNTKITGFNPWTGQIFTKSNSIWVTDKNIESCATQSSPSIQAIRSVGDAQ